MKWTGPWRIVSMKLVPLPGVKQHDLGKRMADAIAGDWWMRPYIDKDGQDDLIIGPVVR